MGSGEPYWASTTNHLGCMNSKYQNYNILWDPSSMYYYRAICRFGLSLGAFLLPESGDDGLGMPPRCDPIYSLAVHIQSV